MSDNNSYVSNTITGTTSISSQASAKFGDVFTEKTVTAASTCEETTCYVGVTGCKSGWSATAPSGEYVKFTDPRYASNQTCYASACPTGYYLTKPSSYFKYDQTTGTAGVTCYKTTGCNTCYASNASGASDTSQGYTCKKKTAADEGLATSVPSCRKNCSLSTSTCGNSYYSSTCGSAKTAADEGYSTSVPSCRKNCSTSTTPCGNSYYASNCGSAKTAADEGYSTSVPSCRKNCSTSTTPCGNSYYASNCGSAKTAADEGYSTSVPSCRKNCSTSTTPCGNSYYASNCGSAKTAADEGYSTSVPSCRKNCSTSTTPCGNSYYASNCGSAKTCSDGGYKTSNSPSSGYYCKAVTYCSNSCYDCSYACPFTSSTTTSCPTGYYTSTTCSSGYTKTSTTGTSTTTYSSTIDGCTKASTTASATCYKCVQDTKYYTVSVSVGSGEYTVSGGGTFKEGSSVTVKFSDDKDYECEDCSCGWCENGSLVKSTNCTSGSWTFTVNADRDLEFNEGPDGGANICY